MTISRDLLANISNRDLTEIHDKVMKNLYDRFVEFESPLLDDEDIINIDWNKSRKRTFSQSMLPWAYEIGIYKIGPKQVKKKRSNQNERYKSAKVYSR